ncbi:MAG: GDP-mannose mannosyl hydrolase, partial [Herminiimonas sp.]|nr:GDP-mannose mannosyl hydrolase [Herminiimonas sp.]
MKLDKERFRSVIETTPLVAIDLVVRNKRGEVLLGRRRNRPAQNSWFVPGGRIFKNERLADALKRISETEIGTVIKVGQLLGVFDHFFDDNVFGIESMSTHYVALVYQCEIDSNVNITPDEQNEELKWWDLG